MNAIHFSIFTFVLIIGEFVGYVSTTAGVPFDLITDAADKAREETKKRVARYKEICDADEHHACCGSNKNPYKFMTHGCCGTEIYKTGERVCCGKTLSGFHDLQNSIQYGCCFNFTVNELKPYTTHNHLCCKGYLRKKVLPNAKYECCGTNIYNVNEQGCCSRTIVDLPETKRNYKCCGNSIMGDEGSFCCDKQVYQLNTGLECCARKTYNRTAGQLCCWKKLVRQNKCSVF